MCVGHERIRLENISPYMGLFQSKFSAVMPAVILRKLSDWSPSLGLALRISPSIRTSYLFNSFIWHCHCSGDMAARMRKALAIPRSCVV